jgi:hypothetical protein
VQNLGFLLYTDPGMGALIWQLTAASLVGAAFYVRQYLRKPKGAISLLRRKRRNRKPLESE